MLKKKLLNFDYILLFFVLCLVFIGMLAIASASKVNLLDIGFNAEFLSSALMNHIYLFFVGFVVLLFASFIDYRFIAKFYIPIYVLNIILLILVLSFGETTRSVRRWLWGIQPSEFSKIFMIIFIATFIHKNNDIGKNILKLIILCILTIIPVLLIQAQPSLSASLVILVILAFQLFAGNLSNKYIKIILIIVVPIAIIIVIDLMFDGRFILNKILTDYQLDRITSIISFDLDTKDDALYQTRNSAWAIGSGQLMGTGMFNGSMNQLNHIPDSLNDFIFSVIGEEFGFIGCCILIFIALLVIGKCLIIAYKSSDMLGTLIVIGVVAMLSFQIFINVGVATGILPNTGMPFPFLSSGGSSMLVNMACIGLVLNVGMIKPKRMFEKI